MSKTHVIDGVAYVEVDRKAEVGDKVLIVKAYRAHNMYHNGDLIDVQRAFEDGVENDSLKAEANDTGFIATSEYVVIEPLESEETPSVTDLLANLARRVEYLERKATSLEQQLRDTQGNVEKLAEELADVKHLTQPKEVEVVTFEKFLDSIADKVAERLVGGDGR